MEQVRATPAADRDRSLDALKGFLIILVVLGHVPLKLFFSGLESSQEYLFISRAIASLDIYFYHMPLFMALGVFFIRSLSLREAKKHFMTIVVPFAFWRLINLPLKFLATGLPGATNAIAGLVVGNFAFLGSPLWFLPALFALKLIFGGGLALRQRLPKTQFSIVIVVATVLWSIYFYYSPVIAAYHVAGYIPWGIDIAVYLLPYAVIIRWLYLHAEKFKYSRLVAVAAIIAGDLLISHFEAIKTISAFPAVIDLAQYSVAFTVPGFIGLIVMSGGILLLFRDTDPGLLLMRGFAFLGRYSFPIYLLSGLLIAEATKGLGFLFQHQPQVHNPMAVLLLTCLTILGLIAIPVVVSRLAMRVSTKFRYVGFTA